MKPIDKLKEIIKEFKEPIKSYSFEYFLGLRYVDSVNSIWLDLCNECGFLTTAEVRRLSQQLLNPK